MSERERLIKEISSIHCVEAASDGWSPCPICVAKLADFIIGEKRRVVEPLIEGFREYNPHTDTWPKLARFMEEAIKRAGITEEHK